jgi:hypothetical protein
LAVVSPGRCLVRISIDVDVSNLTEPAGQRGRYRRMRQFVMAGLVLGGIYAIASAGLVITTPCRECERPGTKPAERGDWAPRTGNIVTLW